MTSETSSHTEPSWTGRAVQVIFVLALAWILWPALKGMYYKSSAAPPIPATQSVSWGTDLAKGMTSATETGKPVLLVFTASWCPPCQVMKHEVWTDPTVRQLADSEFHPVLLDIDLEESYPAAEKYNVESIPTILILDSKGEVKHRSSTMDVSEAVAFLQSK